MAGAAGIRRFRINRMLRSRRVIGRMLLRCWLIGLECDEGIVAGGGVLGF